MQSVLLFQFPADTVAAAVEKIPVEPFPVLVHVDRHDVQVVAVDVLVLEYKIRLVSETEFSRYSRAIFCNSISVSTSSGCGLREMHHRLLDLHLRWQEGEKTLHRLAYVHRSRTVIVDAVGGEKPPLRLVNLLPL